MMLFALIATRLELGNDQSRLDIITTMVYT